MSLTSDSGKIPRALHQLFHVCLWRREEKKIKKSRYNLVATSVTYACTTLFKIWNWPVFTEAHAHASQEWSQFPTNISAHKFLLHLKPYHDSTLPCWGWHIQINSSQMLRTIIQRCHPTIQVTHRFLQVAKCSQAPRIQEVHGPAVLKCTSATKLKH